MLTAAYWVTPDQVSKTAPSGEYLTVGSFMIRGKKNFLPPSPLTMGFGFLFRLEDDSIERHKDDRKIRGLEEGGAERQEVEEVTEGLMEVEIDVEDGESSADESEVKGPLEDIKEETNETEEGKTEEAPEDKDDVVGENASNSSGDEDDEKDDAIKNTEASKEEAEEAVEFPDTDVKVGYDRLGSVEIKTRTVSMSDEAPLEESKVSKKGAKQKMQRMEKTQKGQVNEEPKQKSSRAGNITIKSPP